MTMSLTSAPATDTGRAALARYSVLLVETLTDSVICAELPVRNLKWSQKLNDTATASCTLDARPLRRQGVTPQSATAPVQRSLYVYRDDTPVYGGLITSTQYNAANETVAVGCSDWWWLLDRRVLRPDPASLPPANLAEQEVKFTGMDQNDIVRELLRLAQIGTNRNLRLTTSPGLSYITRDRTYDGFALNYVGDLLRNLCNVINGPDIRFGVAASNSQAAPLRVCLIGTPLLGREGLPLVFEWGGNVLDYDYDRDPSNHVDRVYVKGDGTDEGTPILARDRGTDLLESVDGWPAMDTVVSASSGTIETATLVELGDTVLSQTRGWRTIIETEVSGHQAPYVGTYEAGADARFVASTTYHEIDAASRIVGIDVVVTESEGEVITPILAPMLED